MDDKIKILIASVLKPADDVRSCYKIGQSLAQTNKYEVNIIGFESKKKVDNKNIFLHPLFKFKRNSIKRLIAPIKVFRKYLQLRPQLIIVTTPELLWVMFLIKIIFGTKIIYDAQENYQFNIKQNDVYGGISKFFLKKYIKLTEGLSKHLVDGYLLAEKIYEDQLYFMGNKPYILLLNKTVLPILHKTSPISFPANSSLKFLVTGTLGKEYGTLAAIEVCKQLHKHNSKITLIIIGYAPDNKYLKLVQQAVQNEEYIQLIIGDKPLPQTEIVKEIEKSDVALLPYQLNPNISGRFPTKIYDYLALHIPMIIPPQAKWKAYLDQFNAGLILNFDVPDIERLNKEIYSTSFYQQHPGEEILWRNQTEELVEFLHNLMSK